MYARRTLLVLALLCAAGCQSIVNPESRRIPEIAVVEDGSPQRAALNARVYDTAVRTVTRRFYDRRFNGVDFPAEAAARRTAAVAKPDEAGFYAALNATLDLLDDQHTVAVSPTSFRNLRVNLQVGAPDFGIRAIMGVSAEENRPIFIVTQVRQDSPAAEAGVQPGWVIESLNGEPWETGRSLAPENPDLIHFRDRHGNLHVRSLQARRMPREIGTAVRRPDGVLVLRFFRFDDATEDWLQTRLAEARADPPRGVVIDLRSNGGGTVASATRINGAFFSTSVPFARYSFGVLQRVPRFTRPSRVGWTGPLVVVVGADSASGAEVFAAAVRDHRRGLIVGQPTAGAVVGQISTELPDGGVLKVGYTEFRTASGAILEKIGVKPDIEVVPDIEDLLAGRDRIIDEAARTVLEGAPATALAP